jgi:hypothetical protein
MCPGGTHHSARGAGTVETTIRKPGTSCVFVLVLVLGDGALAEAGRSHVNSSLNARVENDENAASVPDRPAPGVQIHFGVWDLRTERYQEGPSLDTKPGEALRVEVYGSPFVRQREAELEVERNGRIERIKGIHAWWHSIDNSRYAYKFYPGSKLESGVPYKVKRVVLLVGGKEVESLKVPTQDLTYFQDELNSHPGVAHWRNYSLKAILGATSGRKPVPSLTGKAPQISYIGYLELKYRASQFIAPKVASSIVDHQVEALQTASKLGTKDSVFEVFRIITINPDLENYQISEGTANKLWAASLHGLEAEKPGEWTPDGSEFARVAEVKKETEEEATEVRQRNLRALSELRSTFPKEDKTPKRKGTRVLLLKDVQERLTQTLAHDPNEKHRKELIDHVAVFGDDNSRAALFDRARHDPSEEVRIRALEALSDSRQLVQSVAKIRGASPASWNRWEPEVFDLTLDLLLQDKSMEVRKRASYQLRQLAEDRAPKGFDAKKLHPMMKTVLSKTENLKDDAIESDINRMRKALKLRMFADAVGSAGF